MNKTRLVKIDPRYLFKEAAYYYDEYAHTRDQIAYGRYCELRDIMIELNLSKEYINYRFGGLANGKKEEKGTN